MADKFNADFYLGIITAAPVLLVAYAVLLPDLIRRSRRRKLLLCMVVTPTSTLGAMVVVATWALASPSTSDKASQVRNTAIFTIAGVVVLTLVPTLLAMLAYRERERKEAKPDPIVALTKAVEELVEQLRKDEAARHDQPALRRWWDGTHK